MEKILVSELSNCGACNEKVDVVDAERNLWACPNSGCENFGIVVYREWERVHDITEFVKKYKENLKHI